MKILSKYKEAVKKVSKALTEKETLEQEEFYGIIKDFSLKPISA